MASVHDLLLEAARGRAPRQNGYAPFFEKDKGYWSNLNKPQYPEAPPQQAAAPSARFDVENAAPGTNFRDPNWDYKVANASPEKLGMWKEKLPYGAAEWDPNGEPYYGEGFKGWVNGFISRLTAPVGEPTSLAEVAKYLPDANWAQANDPRRNPNYKQLSLAETTSRIGGMAQATGEMGQAAADYLSNVGSEEGGAIMPTTYAARGTGELIRAGLWAFDESSKLFEQYLSTAKWGQANSPYRNPNYKQLTLKETTDRLNDAWQAGRILYTSAVEPTVTKRFLDRYHDGENPEFLAMELENPLAEMAGRIVLDPLNMLGGVTRGIRDMKRASKVAEEFMNIAPDIERAINDVGNVTSDAKALKAIENLTDAAMTAFKKMSDDYGLRALTASGKRHVLGTRTGELAGWIVSNARDDDQAAETFLALARMWGGGSADEIAQGFAAAKHFIHPQPLFSKAGQELGAVLRHALTDPDTGEFGATGAKKFLDGMAKAGQKVVKDGVEEGGAVGLIKYLAEKSGAAIDDILPDITKKIERGMDVPWQYKAINNMHDFAQKTVYKPVNSFLSGMYMGLSPGYVARNLSSNTVQILTDYGPKSFFHGWKPSTLNGKTRELLGGTLPKGIQGFSEGTTGVDVYGAAKALPGIKAAGKMEEVGAAQVVYTSVADTMRKALRPGRALPDIRDLVNAGLPERSAQQLVRMVIDAKGDVKKAVALFREASKTGSIDAWRTLSWLAPADEKALGGFQLLDKLHEAMQADSLEEAIKIFDDGVDDVIKDGGRVAGEVPVIQADSEVAHVIEVMTGEVSDDVLNAATSHSLANSNTWGMYEDAIRDALRGNQVPPEIKKLFNDLSSMRQESVQFSNKIYAWSQRTLHMPENKTNWAKIWKSIGIPGEPPAGLTGEDLRKSLWAYFDDAQTSRWSNFREYYAEGAEAWLAQNPSNMTGQAREALAVARKWDEFKLYKKISGQLVKAQEAGDNAGIARAFANQFNIVAEDNVLLDMINANLEEGVAKFTKLADVPEEVSQKSLLRHATKNLGYVKPKAPPIPYAGNTPSLARAVTEQVPGINDMRARILSQMADIWGQVEPTVMNPKVDQAIAGWAKTAERNVAQARLMAAAVADEARKFTLLSYPEKTYLDLALAYIYPYHFWYTRTYTNWLKRIAQTPEVIAGYAKYREALAKIHAGAPDWWKYNINSNELLGRDDENPWFFNLEATLSPVNGLTGVDFNDSRKRINWWTATLDDMNKFGPSTWTPYSMATAMALYLTGEEEAASRWGGRFIPQTATLKAITHKLNIGPPGGLELDPAVLFFSGGHDPWERSRIGRGMATLQERGELTPEEVAEANRVQSGPAWDMATKFAADQRAPGQIMSFLAGTGFKARSLTDLQIDRFYAEYYNLWDLKDTMTEDEFQEAMDGMRDDYPFMDNLLLARKASPFRDRAYAYSVMGRIPPGQTTEIFEAVGLDPRLSEKFYETKGYVNEWSESDRNRFMAGVVDIGALLAMPDDATKAEWDEAKDMYAEIDGMMEEMFNQPGLLLAQIAKYYIMKDTDKDAANEYADSTNVGAALQWKQAYVMNDPLLSKYYTALDSVEKYYNGVMYDALNRKYPNIQATWDEYDNAKLLGSKEGTAFYKAHPELKEYLTDLYAYREVTAKMTANVSKALPDTPLPFLRPGVTPESLGEQDVSEYVQQPQETVYDYTWNDWAGMMSPQLANLVLDYAFTGEDLSSTARDQVEYIAEQNGISPELMLELMAQSVQR